MFLPANTGEMLFSEAECSHFSEINGENTRLGLPNLGRLLSSQVKTELVKRSLSTFSLSQFFFD